MPKRVRIVSSSTDELAPKYLHPMLKRERSVSTSTDELAPISSSPVIIATPSPPSELDEISLKEHVDPAMDNQSSPGSSSQQDIRNCSEEDADAAHEEQPQSSQHEAGSEQATAAWNRRFASRQVTLNKEDELPFKPGRTLGRGGLGIVVETEIEGIAVAWKRTYTRRLTEQHTNELKILNQLSTKRHKHIVELIGSYTHRQRGIYEIGILLWPVAQCDLAGFMQEMDALKRWMNRCPGDVSIRKVGYSIRKTPITSALGSSTHISEEDQSTWESLVEMTSGSEVFESTLFESLFGLYYLSQIRLASCYRCLASAVLYLHSNGIRHKDIKPSQILLTAEGLWLTDFGWSKDISSLTNSATSGGDTTTIRYQAPERVQFESCGRAEDIFALGCTFLEMSYCMIWRDSEALLNPSGSKFWSYQANLSQLHEWMEPLDDLYIWLSDSMVAVLPALVESMLEFSPPNRPSIDTIVDKLRPRNDDGAICNCHHAWPVPSTPEALISRNATPRGEGRHVSMPIMPHLIPSRAPGPDPILTTCQTTPLRLLDPPYSFERESRFSQYQSSASSESYDTKLKNLFHIN